MKISRLKTLAIITTAMVTAHSAQAGTWSLGLGAAAEKTPYRSYDTRVLPLPIINYEGDSFYLRSLAGGFYLWKDDANRLSLEARYGVHEFRPGDSDNSQLRQLNKRRDTLMAGVKYDHFADWGIIRTGLFVDALNNSNGVEGDVAYLYKFEQGDWTLTPGVGVEWSSKNQNKYYYGVNSSESARSGLSSYTPGNSFQPYAEISANYKINSSWNASGSVRYIRLSDEITDSPMVDKSYSGLVWAGVSYTF